MSGPAYDPVPGMRVVCVDDAWDAEFVIEGFAYPRRGVVYTIKSVGTDVVIMGLRFPGVWLGLHEAAGPWQGAPEFLASAFLPVDERRLDIFRAALTTTPAPREKVSA